MKSTTRVIEDWKLLVISSKRMKIFGYVILNPEIRERYYSSLWRRLNLWKEKQPNNLQKNPNTYLHSNDGVDEK